MADYRLTEKDFIIKNFDKQKPFASFLPAVAGKTGKPLWAFYCNRGQAVSGFGVNGKQTPICPFDTAVQAYQNVALKNFRTFLKLNGKFAEPFSPLFAAKREMHLSFGKIVIKESTNDYIFTVSYTTVPNEDYAGLIRAVTFKWLKTENCDYEIIDGLAVMLAHGFDNYCYKEMANTSASYNKISYPKKRVPVMHFSSNPISDCSKIEKINGGNFFYTVGADGLFNNIVDSKIIFGEETALITPVNFIARPLNSLLKLKQRTENFIPSGFSCKQGTLKRGETLTFSSVYGYAEDADKLIQKPIFNLNYLSEKAKENIDLLKELACAASLKSGDTLFDKYFLNCYLDNNLRGGTPYLIGKHPYYLFSRKHGDMERDYNAFNIPAQYYSCGEGNFRDVNQNRRNDLFFAPFLYDYNVKTFFDLIQLDGYNPLKVKPPLFFATQNEKLKKIAPDLYDSGFFSKDFSLSELSVALKSHYGADKLFTEILNCCEQELRAEFCEGYWIDHFTYNLDLIENFEGIYPDKMDELLFTKKYRYFDSGVSVLSRAEKYKISGEQVRQYESVSCKNSKSDWLKDADGKTIKTSLCSKLINLAIIKFASLDAFGYGIEMEADKPGWCDAMNGLPALLGSGVAESCELIRLFRFIIGLKYEFGNRTVEIFEEQSSLYHAVKDNFILLVNKKISKIKYWDLVNNAKENFRETVTNGVSGKNVACALNDVISDFSEYASYLDANLSELKRQNGILPTYLTYQPIYGETIKSESQKSVKSIIDFKQTVLPIFLEAPARELKLLPKDAAETYEKIKNSGLYDKILKLYKTSADISGLPYEAGRITAFSKGWLERETDFLHMTFKYLLGLLKCGLYEQFYSEARNNFTCYMNPKIYGRNILENVSFIAPSVNSDASSHGQGFYARLTGANSEILNIAIILLVGEQPFTLENGRLTLKFCPKLSKDFFDSNGKIAFRFLGKTDVIYINKQGKNLYSYDGEPKIFVEGKNVKAIIEKDAENVRSGKIKNIAVEF